MRGSGLSRNASLRQPPTARSTPGVQHSLTQDPDGDVWSVVVIKQKLKRRLRRAKRMLITPRQTHGRSPSGAPLPPVDFRMGGKHFESDNAFTSSAISEVDRLVALAGLTKTSRLLDWGCGAGRLAVGIAERFGRIQLYRGVDVQKPLIAWADRHIGSREGFEFVHVDIVNARYNPGGAAVQEIPGGTSSIDVFYAYSVFSHLNGTDCAAYMHELSRVLAAGGQAFITAFVEDGVPNEEENPTGYGPMRWSGALHCVRFERRHFLSFIADAGLDVVSLVQGQETDDQSLFILRKQR